MRHFLFIDESGEACINTVDLRFNVFVLCGIIFREDDYAEFDEQMKKLKRKHFGTEQVIFHSVEMRKQTNAFKIFQDEAVLASFYADIGPIFTNSRYKLFSCVINKEQYKARYQNKNQAYEDSLKFLCERGLYHIKATEASGTLHVCLEKRQKGKDNYLIKYYKSFIKYGTDYVSTYDLLRCDKRLHFRGKQANINGLQFADLCAYPIARKHLSPSSRQPTYDLFEKNIYSSFWGKIKGYGIKYFP